ncbi:MAG: ankyrin repeat domain-containing protein [Phycisphaeraceae bacterium]
MFQATHTNPLLLSCLLCAITFAASADSKAPAPLADAAEQRDAANLTLLLKQGAAIDVAQADGMTALLWAAYHDDFATAQALIRAGANVKTANRYGVTALSLACRNGNGAMVKLLLDKGADANTALKGGETALMTASRTGKIEAVKALLDKGADVHAKEQHGQTALMWAAAEGHAEVVDALIRAKADYKSALKSGFTPLSFAVRNGHIEVTKRLLSTGVDVTEAMTEARGGRDKPIANTSPLLLAMENGHFELAEVLLKAGADPNDDRTGFAPLHAMSWIRKPERGDNETGTPPPRGSGKLTSLDFVRKLVEHGADVNYRKKANGGGRLRISVKDTTPFLCAASTADVPYMKVLLELRADPKQKNGLDQPALLLAAGIAEAPEGDGPASADEHLEAVAFLLKLGADVNAIDKNGETAMHGAAYKSLPKVVQLLTERGADIRIWSKKTRQDRTPLSIAEGYRPGNFKPSFETVDAIRKVMIAQGVTPPPPPGKGDQREEYKD